MNKTKDYKNADGLVIKTDAIPPALLHWLLQPAFVIFVYFSATGALPFFNVYSALLVCFGLLTVAERIWPARKEWVQTHSEWFQVLAMFVLSALAIGLVESVKFIIPLDSLGSFYAATRILWPESWYYPLQVLLAFTFMQFFAYWLHRWQHEIGLLWKSFGHGTHHTYTKLNTINWSATHPFEALFLVLPAILFILIFGYPELALVASALIMLTTAFAHANLRLNERVIGWVFTTNSQHMHHHSSVFEESQTNYGCAMTLWDRLFGTFRKNNTQSLGDEMEGKRTLWKRLTVPLK